MSIWNHSMTRRTFFAGSAALAAAFTLNRSGMAAAGANPIRRTIPSTGEGLPVIGMGTWLTFDVGGGYSDRSILMDVLREFFAGGGKVIDTSPMYGRSEVVLGELLEQTAPDREGVFAATKVWTNGRQEGIRQMRQSMQRMGVETLDLMQIQNLRDWQTHLPVLREWKAQGIFRYIGITTSHGISHDEMARIMRSEPLDFVQFTYNIVDRQAE